MKKTIILFIYILIANYTFGQNYTVYGTIRNTEGELLPGASIYINELKTGVVSNNYGFYSITLLQGKYEILYSFVGCNMTKKEILLSENMELNIEIESNISEIGEVQVNDSKENNNANNTSISRQTIDIEQIKKLPALAGEPDIIKSLQLMPGIQTSNEGTTNLSIRGGSSDQNLVLLDEAPVYNVSHALSFFSVFNPEALKNVTVYKGLYPPEYGGRVSSVIDIKMREGNKKKFTVSGGSGIIASRLTIEGPLKKDKSSFIISGRYSYAGFVANKLGTFGQKAGMKSLRDFDDKNKISFYDINAKVNFTINNKNHLYISTYTGADRFYFFNINDNSSMDWGNTTGTFRWNKIYNSKLFSNLSLIYSSYGYSYILIDDARRFEWSAGMQLSGLKYDFDYYRNQNHKFKFGINTTYNTYQPGSIEPRDTISITKAFYLPDKQALNLSAYISDEYKVNNKITTTVGLRYSGFLNVGSGTVYSYSNDMAIILDSSVYKKGEIICKYGGAEPYFALKYLLNHKSSLNAGYGHKLQYQHLISNSTVGLPTDVWLPADSYIKPQISDNFSIGYFRNSADNIYEFSTEIYFRKLKQIIDYKDNADLFLNSRIETQILSGKAHAYGLEIFLNKKSGIFTGFISYTLSKTQQIIKGVNNGLAYSPRFDKRNNLSLNLNTSFSKKWSFSTVFRYISGGFITIPEGTFMHYGVSFNYYSNRNAYKLPPFHSLDVSLRRQTTTSKGRISEWIFAVNNVYNRKNLFSLFIKQDDFDLSISKAYKMYIFEIFPSVTYNFKF